MAFAPSNKTIVFTTFTADTAAALVANLSAILSTVWASSVGITGGNKFTISSPDAPFLGVKCKVFDDGTVNFVRIQFLSLDEARVGFAHYLKYAIGKVYQVWANCCSLFISVNGISVGSVVDHSCVAGGIPFVPRSLVGQCGIDIAPLITEIWWSNGADTNDNNFRWTIRPLSWSACFNGNLMVTTGGGTNYTELNSLRLIPMHLSLPWPLFFGTVPRTKFFGTDPDLTTMYFDPLIAWGDNLKPESIGKIRGQLYDAAMGSVYVPVDTLLTTQGFKFVNYMGDVPAHVDATRFSSLWLMTGKVAGGNANLMY